MNRCIAVGALQATMDAVAETMNDPEARQIVQAVAEEPVVPLRPIIGPTVRIKCDRCHAEERRQMDETDRNAAGRFEFNQAKHDAEFERLGWAKHNGRVLCPTCLQHERAKGRGRLKPDKAFLKRKAQQEAWNGGPCDPLADILALQEQCRTIGQPIGKNTVSRDS